MKKISFSLVFGIWLLVALIEICGPFFIDEKFFFWRSWEIVTNDDSTNVGIMPYKPLMNVSFNSGGDIAHPNFLSSKSQVFNQEFITDEYGFRNRPYLIKEKVEVVLFGTSQVVGASETQHNLVSNILNEKYGVRTYNYAKALLQQFLNEERFVKNPPKYVVLLGQDFEFTSKSYMQSLKEGKSDYKMKVWTKEEWRLQELKNKRLLNRDYLHTKEYAKRYSTARIIADAIFRTLISKIYSNDQLIDVFGKGQYEYDEDLDMIFPLSGIEDPRLGSESKTKKEIVNAVKLLSDANKILQKRGITLIVGAMPSKSYLYRDAYKDVPVSDSAIHFLDQQIAGANIQRIPILETIMPLVSEQKIVFYYPHDTHWNNKANELIARLLSEKIKKLEETSSF